MTTLHASSILSQRLQHKVVGYETPQGRVYCKDCGNKLKVEKQETFYSDDRTDWSITCERCEDSILEPED